MRVGVGVVRYIYGRTFIKLIKSGEVVSGLKIYDLMPQCTCYISQSLISCN